MKKYQFILLCFIVFTCSCGDSWLELKPQTSVETDKAIQSSQDAEYAINGIYNTMQSYEYYGARMVYYGDVTGEDAQAASNTKRCADYYLFQYNRDNAPTSLWKYPYKIMRLANNILAANPSHISNNIKGQALAIRALALFDVNRVYGYPYTKNNGQSLGGIIMLTPPLSTTKPTRNTVAECYAQIVEDLTVAIPLLDNSKTPGKINRQAAKALLARVYLYMGNYTKALEYAETVITESNAIGYRLWTNAEYITAWVGGLDTEVLFKIINTTVDNEGNESLGNLYHEKGYKDIIPSSDFKALLNEEASDIRLKFISSKGYYTKYIGNSTDEDQRSSDIPIIRLSEVYLIAAEAAVQTLDNDKAVSYLNAIVSRANPSKTVSGTVTLAQVLKERRKELMGEGHRMFDAMRNNVTIERKGSSHLTALTSDARKYNWDYYKIVLPIPKYEMDANENIRNQQNPGY